MGPCFPTSTCGAASPFNPWLSGEICVAPWLFRTRVGQCICICATINDLHDPVKHTKISNDDWWYCLVHQAPPQFITCHCDETVQFSQTEMHTAASCGDFMLILQRGQMRNHLYPNFKNPSSQYGPMQNWLFDASVSQQPVSPQVETSQVLRCHGAGSLQMCRSLWRQLPIGPRWSKMTKAR